VRVKNPHLKKDRRFFVGIRLLRMTYLAFRRSTNFVNSRGNAVNGRSKADSTLRKRQGGHAAKTAPKAFGVANGFLLGRGRGTSVSG